LRMCAAVFQNAYNSLSAAYSTKFMSEPLPYASFSTTLAVDCNSSAARVPNNTERQSILEHMHSSKSLSDREASHRSFLFLVASFMSRHFERLKQIFQDVSVQTTVLITSVVVGRYLSQFSDGSIVQCSSYASSFPYSFKSTETNSTTTVFIPSSYLKGFCKPQVAGTSSQLNAFIALVVVNQICFALSSVFKAKNVLSGHRLQKIIAWILFAIAFVAAVSKIFLVFGFLLYTPSFSGCGCSTNCPTSNFIDCTGVLSLDSISPSCSNPVTGGQCSYQSCSCSDVGSFDCQSSCVLNQPYEMYVLVITFPLSAMYISMSLYEWAHVSFSTSSTAAEVLSLRQRIRSAFRLAADFSVFLKYILTAASLLFVVFSPYNLVSCGDLKSPADGTTIFPGAALTQDCNGALNSAVWYGYILTCCFVVFLLQLVFNALVIERERMLAVAQSLGFGNAAVSVVVIFVILDAFLKISTSVVTFVCNTHTNSQSYYCLNPNVINILNPSAKAYPFLPCSLQCSVRIPLSMQLLVLSLLQNVVYLMASCLQFAFKGYKFQRQQAIKANADK
jgi:hypothetical protein